MAGAAHAAKVERVDIRGLDETMTTNVQVSLSIVDAIGKELSGRRMAYLLREAENETREALEPFGYYSPRITIERTRDGVTTVVNAATPAAAPGTPTPAPLAPLAPEDPTQATERRANTSPVLVTITVDLGTPVTVRQSDLAIDGEGGEDKYLLQDLEDFVPREGEVFDHELYEASKARITRRLAERGYFDADFAARRVEVTRADNAADIHLAWTSGERYDMGPTTFVQNPRILRESLLTRQVYWEEGSYYHQGKLDRLRDSLARLDYFAGIDIEPHPDEAQDGRVPVTVTLTPAKRTIYTAGLSYGTDSGAGVRLGMERRYLNDRGHKALAQLDWAQRRKTFTMQYRIPAFAWADGWYTATAQFADEQTDYIDTRRIELIASRSGEINDQWTVVASVHGLRERWAYEAEEDDDPATPTQYQYGTFLYPSLRAEYVDADDRLYPRDALGGTAMLRGGVEGAGSDVSFAQVHVTARWYRGLGDKSRLITRGEVGHTFVDDEIATMPPSLRFHAGGDRSIRGYAWREVGPRIGEEGDEFPVGARNVVTGSVEYEQYFGKGEWGAAAFVDGGSAFDDAVDWRTGVGVGLRWRSPVGPLRLDIAHGLDDPDSAFQIYLNIGADL
ncbi:outer membrane protein assembly factor [Lysobacter solisilvae]|uniref:Translocation and assembly module subunit TamA n=1 Tax=Agrilutibacter solisilvae TaxID=2763317 RepID=A0A975AU14_9GAMM|nr:outer membrane protein assembly factor [Lysobacter solisilvae]